MLFLLCAKQASICFRWLHIWKYTQLYWQDKAAILLPSLKCMACQTQETRVSQLPQSFPVVNMIWEAVHVQFPTWKLAFMIISDCMWRQNYCCNSNFFMLLDLKFNRSHLSITKCNSNVCLCQIILCKQAEVWMIKHALLEGKVWIIWVSWFTQVVNFNELLKKNNYSVIHMNHLHYIFYLFV